MTYSDNNNAIDKINFGDHVCSIYQNKEQQFSLVISYIIEGLNSNQKCVYVMDESTDEDIKLEFNKVGFGIDKYLESGQLELLKSKDIYTVDGTFDQNKMLATVEAIERKALEDGYFGLRGTGEMGVSLHEKVSEKELIDYESKLNEFLVGRKIALICQYNENFVNHKILNNIIRTHPFTIIYGKMYENKYFYTAPEYMEEGSNLLPSTSYKTIIDTIITE